ncbi:MAG: ATP-binding cassette domain-containing protein [Rhizobiales bacterium]|nr:ATP-binding cassette domain-containing protein [Hyphomicrobiales bacterium]
MTDSPAKITCRNIWKIFGPDPSGFLARHGGAPTLEQLRAGNCIGAVRDVSFDARAGEILIFMGLSGSGKSTLIRAITRLNDPTSGQIILDGQDLMKATPEELIELRRHKLGMVFQHFGLLPHRDVLANVAFPLEVRGEKREDRIARAMEMIKLVGLEGRENYFPRELSGGQQQRVGIARSLAVEPDVWFLDEPFSALDPLIRREMQDEFLRLQRLLKKTIVFITHDFEEAVRLGDRIGIMKDGELVQLATAEEMVTAPANDYVRAFTRNAPRERIVTIGAIVDTAIPAPASPVISSATKIGDAAAQVLASDTPVGVVDAAGRMIGAVTRQRMIAALFTGNRA